MEIRMDLYRIFNVTASSSSISEAAEKLYMTQSAVSQSIKQLESLLDTALFVRTRKGIELTSEGEILKEYTSGAIELISTGQKRLSSFKELNEGELIIGAGDTISSYYLLPLLEKYHKLYPGIRIEIINRVSNEAVELLKAGKIDLAFVNLPINDHTLDITECIDVHDIFVAGKSFEHLRNKELSRREISELPLILLEKKSRSRNYVDSVFEKSGCVLNADIELGAHELLLQLASINLGVSCVIKEFSKKYLEEGDVFEIKQKNPIPARSVGCCSSKRITLSPAALKFLEMARSDK